MNSYEIPTSGESPPALPFSWGGEGGQTVQSPLELGVGAFVPNR